MANITMETIVIKSVYKTSEDLHSDSDSDSETDSFLQDNHENAVMDKIRRLYERVPFNAKMDREKKRDEYEVEGTSVWRKLKSDVEYKRKVLLSLSLLWAFVILVSLLVLVGVF